MGSLFMLMAASAIPAGAQLANTGGSGWEVNVYTVSGGTWSGWYTALNPAGGEPGVWTPSNGTAQWISAWSDFSTSPGAGDYNNLTDANARYHYLYRYTFPGALGAGNLAFSAGWDNILKGFQFDNSAFLSPPSGYQVGSTDRSVNNYFGFCRTADAMNNTGDASCVADFNVPVLAGAKWLELSVWGDGQTDGLWLAWDQASVPEAVVPEPATMTLLATGLVGLAGSSLRRRRSAKTT